MKEEVQLKVCDLVICVFPRLRVEVRFVHVLRFNEDADSGPSSCFNEGYRRRLGLSVDGAKS